VLERCRWIGCGRSSWEIIAEFSREMGVLREIGAAEVLRDGALRRWRDAMEGRAAGKARRRHWSLRLLCRSRERSDVVVPSLVLSLVVEERNGV